MSVYPLLIERHHPSVSLLQPFTYPRAAELKRRVKQCRDGSTIWKGEVTLMKEGLSGHRSDDQEEKQWQAGDSLTDSDAGCTPGASGFTIEFHVPLLSKHFPLTVHRFQLTCTPSPTTQPGQTRRSAARRTQLDQAANAKQVPARDLAQCCNRATSAASRHVPFGARRQQQCL